MGSLKWAVLKFGGTSVSTRVRWETVYEVCEKRKKEGYRPFLVCSALSGVSNDLEKLIQLSLKGDFGAALESIRSRYLDFSQEMGLDNGQELLSSSFEELEKLALGLSLLKVSSPPVSAKILSFGERMLTTVAHAWLQSKGLSVCLLGSSKIFKAPSREGSNECQDYLSATCKSGYDEGLVSFLSHCQESVFLTEGFLASNEKEETVLLGRGGSDLSAALLAEKIQADKIEIWSDVPGLFTTNPRQIPGARLLAHLDYEEAQELSFCGAKVLHPKCLEPLKESRIPLELKWTERPDYEGTLINHNVDPSPLKVKAVIAKKNVWVVSMDSVDMWQTSGFLAQVFDSFKKYGLSVDLVATSQSNVTVTLDVLANSLNEEILEKLLARLREFCEPKKIGPCAMISLVGKNIKTFFPELGSVLKTFKERNCFLMTQASSDLNFSFLVNEEDADKIVEELHSICFGGVVEDSLLGESWQELYATPDKKRIQKAEPSYWWVSEREKLLNLMENEEALYVYKKELVKNKYSSLSHLKALSRISYAMKANDHKSILETLYKEGSCFDCVSFKEVLYLKSLFPEIEPSRIAFTPNFAPIREYKEALEFGCVVTLDNLYLLEEHGQIFSHKNVFLRLDPGSGRGHHEYVHTAGKQSKFGISLASMEKVQELVAKHSIQVVGLHAHTGSGILDPHNWKETALILSEMASFFPSVKVLNLGGGLGVPDTPLDDALDLEALGKILSDVKGAHPEYELWIEPGRYLVAEAGVLLMKVTQKKKKEDKNFVGVATGMNSLIRPSLYGAHHEIVNLTHLNGDKFFLADVVGPICESGDVLGYDRSLPVETGEGDTLLLNNAGAYGRVMASSYNQREPAREFVL